MQRCSQCGTDADLPFQCQYYEGVYCESHRLPEAHDCDGVEFLSASGYRFESKFSDEIVAEEDDIQPAEPISPEYTVGTTPDPDFAPAPDTELKESAHNDEDGGVIQWLRRLLPW